MCLVCCYYLHWVELQLTENKSISVVKNMPRKALMSFFFFALVMLLSSFKRWRGKECSSRRKRSQLKHCLFHMKLSGATCILSLSAITLACFVYHFSQIWIDRLLQMNNYIFILDILFSYNISCNYLKHNDTLRLQPV